MREWRTIRRDIYAALSNYDCNVYYHRPTSDGECGYFEINIDDEFDEDWIEGDLADLCEEWDLDFDWHGTELDLNAYWDMR